LDGLTRSSSARARNTAAWASLLLGLLGIALPVVAFAAARRLSEVTLIQATGASCGSVLLGGSAIMLGRRAVRTIERTLGRVGGEGTARAGRILGLIGLCLGLTAGIALGVYALLNLFG
jgi:hypothetical protein